MLHHLLRQRVKSGGLASAQPSGFSQQNPFVVSHWRTRPWDVRSLGGFGFLKGFHTPEVWFH